MAREIGVARQHLLGRGTTEDIIHEVTIVRLEPRAPGIFMSKIKLNARRAVEKEAPGLSISQRQGKRDRDIQVILQGGMAARRIDVPEELMRTRFIQFAGAFATAK